MNPFSPNSTVSLAVTTATGSVAFGKGITNPPSVRVYNAGVVTVFINAGGAAVTAAVTDLPIAPGTVETLNLSGKTSPSTHVAAITASGTATIYFTPGDGI